MAVDDYIRKPPKFQIFKPYEDGMTGSVLALALTKAHEALAAVNSNRFYPCMLQAFEQFVLCDSYPVFAELLTKRKEMSQINETIVKRFNVVFNLLDAHVFAKVGDADLECKSLLAFLRVAYTDLTTNQLAKIVTTVFYRSLFSIKIYTYKESH